MAPGVRPSYRMTCRPDFERFTNASSQNLLKNPGRNLQALLGADRIYIERAQPPLP
jgi:hypothetical protein